jgi:hypothetical protein
VRAAATAACSCVGANVGFFVPMSCRPCATIATAVATRSMVLLWVWGATCWGSRMEGAGMTVADRGWGVAVCVGRAEEEEVVLWGASTSSAHPIFPCASSQACSMGSSNTRMKPNCACRTHAKFEWGRKDSVS